MNSTYKALEISQNPLKSKRYFIKEDYDQHLRKLIDLTHRAVEEDKFPIAACLIGPGGEELACSLNTQLDASAVLGNTSLGHAEITVILQACKKLNTMELPKGCVMIITCEPCLMCYGAMQIAGIKSFVYANSVDDTYQFREFGFIDKELYEDVEQPIHIRKMPGHQMLQVEAFEVLEKWKSKLHKKGVRDFKEQEGKKYLQNAQK